MKKYTYSRALELDPTCGIETFQACEFDSWEECQAAVEKGIKDRRLQIEAHRKIMAIEKQNEQSNIEGPHTLSNSGSTTPRVKNVNK